jgi:hypothetical protein
VDALERVTATLVDWKPEMEGTVDDIWIEVGKLSKHWEHVVRERSPPLLPIVPSSSTPPAWAPQAPMYGLPHPAEDPKSSSTPERPSATGNVDRPNGHRFDNHHREGGYGSVTTIVHPPVTGACKLPTPPPLPNFLTILCHLRGIIGERLVLLVLVRVICRR